MNIFFIGVVVSILVYIVVGIWAGRSVKDVNDYYVSGRNAPTILIAGTLFASMLRKRVHGRPDEEPRQHYNTGIAKFHVCNGLYCRTTYVRTIFKAVRMYNNAGIFRSALLRSEKPESCRNYYSSFPHSVFALMYHRSWNFNAGTDRAFL